MQNKVLFRKKKVKKNFLLFFFFSFHLFFRAKNTLFCFISSFLNFFLCFFFSFFYSLLSFLLFFFSFWCSFTGCYFIISKLIVGEKTITKFSSLFLFNFLCFQKVTFKQKMDLDRFLLKTNKCFFFSYSIY